MKKNTLLFLATFFCVIFLYAQPEKNENNTYLSNEEVFQQAELVFEGNYLKFVHTYNPLGTSNEEDTYGILSFQVQKVYKGDRNLEGGTIYVTHRGTLLGYEKSRINNLDDIEELAFITPFLKENGIPGITSGSTALFFLVHSDFPDDENSKYYQYQKYKSLGNRYNLYVFENKFAGLNNLAFKNRDELYQYMKQFEGYNTPE